MRMMIVGALLVYDITDQDSFAKVQNWVKELRKMLGTDVALCIVGNKCDLEKNRQVPLEDAKTYAASVGAVHYSTSAKLNKGVDDMFFDLSTRMLEKFPASGLSAVGVAGRPGAARPSSASSSSRQDLRVDFETRQSAQQQSEGGGCC